MAERRPSTFRQRDLTAAIKGAERAGKHVFSVEIAKDGTIKVNTFREAENARGANPWDEALP
jgi:hypothetical protein